jgi:hypothetical protein
MKQVEPSNNYVDLIMPPLTRGCSEQRRLFGKSTSGINDQSGQPRCVQPLNEHSLGSVWPLKGAIAGNDPLIAFLVAWCGLNYVPSKKIC